MPTYEYACNSCSHRFETRQRMTDDPITTCPECHGSIYRVLFPVGIVFKGSGFYKTDNSPNEEKKSEDRKDGEASSSDDKSKTSSKEKATSAKEKPTSAKGESSSTDAAASASGAY